MIAILWTGWLTTCLFLRAMVLSPIFRATIRNTGCHKKNSCQLQEIKLLERKTNSLKQVTGNRQQVTNESLPLKRNVSLNCLKKRSPNWPGKRKRSRISSIAAVHLLRNYNAFPKG